MRQQVSSSTLARNFFSHKEHKAFWDLASSVVLKYNHALDVLPMGIDVMLLEVELPLELGDAAINQDNSSCYQIAHAHKKRGVGVVCYQ